jgi:hypothetical protein
MSKTPPPGTYILKRNSVVNNVLIVADLEYSLANRTTGEIKYRDLAKNKEEVTLVLKNPTLGHIVASHLEQRRFDAARVYARADGVHEVADQWGIEWQGKRCMHGGMPNAAAMVLLRGLRKPVRHAVNFGPDGRLRGDKVIPRLLDASLVHYMNPIQGKRRASVMTSLRGYALLKYWAEKKGTFEPFFKAYCPPNWEDEHVADRVLNAITSQPGDGAYEVMR